ncbi:MAG: imidazole glycerol phosphate synthase subunit HisH [Burkholderiales bacterium]|jgi:glutamine amidotransferase|nr:imidazole glycerol phosphate synthase subunit HisH [Burkholderiales bacterium]
MMRVVILDTGCANLASLQYAIQRLGYTPHISVDEKIVRNADRLFLPGVGSAQAAMQKLRERKLIELIRTLTQPVLGICLGMQLLGKHSEEGNTKTLGLIDVPVIRMETDNLPLPHMGWNTLTPQADHPLFEGISNKDHFYFVHSFAMPISAQTIAQSEYGIPFSVAVQQDHFYGVQFHPERSGRPGACLLKNFLELQL